MCHVRGRTATTWTLNPTAWLPAAVADGLRGGPGQHPFSCGQHTALRVASAVPNRKAPYEDSDEAKTKPAGPGADRARDYHRPVRDRRARHPRQTGCAHLI